MAGKYPFDQNSNKSPVFIRIELGMGVADIHLLSTVRTYGSKGFALIKSMTKIKKRICKPVSLQHRLGIKLLKFRNQSALHIVPCLLIRRHQF